jgi:Protein of unknown function DUF262/Protein of unknown function (DUF1524)
MDANPYALRQILSLERRFVIPTFQRDYEWTRDGQWQLLFDDLEQVAERLRASRQRAEKQGQEPSRADNSVGPHFLGAIVLDQIPTPAGGLDVRAVVDGQQRLTTMHLLLRGMLDALADVKSTRAPSVRRLLENPEDVVGNADERHKLWPRKHDRDAWRTVMGTDSPSANHVYADARRYFAERSRQFISGEDPHANASLLVDAALDLLKIVVIDLDENDDAQVIFEVLNGRQTPLTAADLVKNLLFLRAEVENEGQLDELYQQYWSQFDNPWWKVEVGSGHAARRRTDMLLAAWLTATFGEEASPDRLYGRIRQHVNSGEVSITQILRAISRFSTEYRVIYGADFEPSDRLRVAYGRLTSLGITTALPALLWLRSLTSDKCSQQDHEAAVVAIESFVIRRSLIGAQTRGYGAIFAEALAKAQLAVESGANVADAMKLALASNTQNRSWPSDEELLGAFTNRRVYGVDATHRVRMILGALDARLRAANPKAEPGSFNYDQLTIEHIMPQSWRDHWPLPPNMGDADAELAGQRRDEEIDRFGNLTLVTKALNPALSNAPWHEKRAALIANSTLALNTWFADLECWDEATIKERGLMMARTTIEEWPGPPGQHRD